MVEGTGTTVADEIGGNNGTFVGNTQWSSGNVPVLEVNYDYSVASSIVTFENRCVDASYYLWDFGDGNTSNAFEPSHTYLNSGTYEVKLKAGNACQEIIFVQNITISNVGNLDPFTAADLCSTGRLDYIATTFDPQFGADQDFTVEFRMRSFGWDGDPAIVSDKDWDSGGNAGFVVALNGNSIKVNVGSGGPRTVTSSFARGASAPAASASSSASVGSSGGAPAPPAASESVTLVGSAARRSAAEAALTSASTSARWSIRSSLPPSPLWSMPIRKARPTAPRPRCLRAATIRQR
jgi:PKD repeat protein